jgi:hypothetical protein
MNSFGRYDLYQAVSRKCSNGGESVFCEDEMWTNDIVTRKMKTLKKKSRTVIEIFGEAMRGVYVMKEANVL